MPLLDLNIGPDFGPISYTKWALNRAPYLVDALEEWTRPTETGTDKVWIVAAEPVKIDEDVVDTTVLCWSTTTHGWEITSKALLERAGFEKDTGFQPGYVFSILRRHYVPTLEDESAAAAVKVKEVVNVQ